MLWRILFTASLLIGRPAAAQDVVRIGEGPFISGGGFFVAEARGYFKKMGLDVQVKKFNDGAFAVPGLVAGELDLALMPANASLFNSIAKGAPLVLVLDRGHNRPGFGYLTINVTQELYDQGIRTMADLAKLKGKKVGVTRGAGGEPYIAGLLQQVGLTMDDVTLVNTAPSAMATALANKDADVIASWEPWPSAALTKVPGSYKVIYGGCKSCYDAGTVVTTKQVIADKPKQLEQFILAYAQGQNWARNNREEAAKISTRWIPGMDAETLTLALKSLPLDVRLSKNTIDGFKSYSIPLLVSQKRIPQAFDPAPAVDNRFVAAAMKADPSAFADLKEIPAAQRL